MKIDDYVGKGFKSDTFGKVKVLGRVPKSRTLLEVEVLDKGEGWNKKTKTYRGVTRKFKDKDGQTVTNWNRGQNREFGTKDELHKNDLN